MKALLLLLLVSSFCVSSFASNNRDDSIVVCQFNMRCAAKNDGRVISEKIVNGKKVQKRDGTHPWGKRMPLIQNFLRYHDVDICGSQEMFKKQIEAMRRDMSDVYEIFGTTTIPSRDKINRANHNNVIFYKRDRFELLESGVFWLSETPEKESAGWGAEYPRNCNWGKFKDKKTGKIFFYFNTHFHHIGNNVRVESAKLFAKKIKEIAGDNTFYAMGDLNARPDSEPIKILKESGFMYDASKICKTPLYGADWTLNGGYSGKKSIWIDWVFVSKSVNVFKCGVMSECINGIWLSDHFPLLLKVGIK